MWVTIRLQLTFELWSKCIKLFNYVFFLYEFELNLVASNWSCWIYRTYCYNIETINKLNGLHKTKKKKKRFVSRFKISFLLVFNVASIDTEKIIRLKQHFITIRAVNFDGMKKILFSHHHQPNNDRQRQNDMNCDEIQLSQYLVLIAFSCGLTNSMYRLSLLWDNLYNL